GASRSTAKMSRAAGAPPRQMEFIAADTTPAGWRLVIAAKIGQFREALVLVRATTVLLFFLGFVLPQAAAAQDIAVTGKVDDPQGGVIVGATVTLTAAGASRPMTARTNAEGTFSLSVPPGRYTLQIDSPGFTTWTLEFVVG